MKGGKQLPLALAATLGAANTAGASSEGMGAVRTAGGPGKMEFGRYTRRRDTLAGQSSQRRQSRPGPCPLCYLRLIRLSGDGALRTDLHCGPIRLNPNPAQAVRAPEGRANPHQHTVP